ncbi:hypothetical protein HYQ46_002521 [Verticillium longisporum]|nr:hypothetical protein HYQ46_002521 [Verticillium longisporum]
MESALQNFQLRPSRLHWMDHPFPAAIGSQELSLLVFAAHHLADIESFFPASGSTRYTLSTARENVSPILVCVLS